MIFDFDVHHGNGTNDIFRNDPSVLFVSTHEENGYPGTGRVGMKMLTTLSTTFQNIL